MTPSLPIGIDDFRLLREQGLVYVDKTQMVCELIDDPGAQVLLLPRPRRFGKSLNLSMLRCWFERSDEKLDHLFEGLHVWDAGAPYRAHFQRYPVVYLNFKDLKPERADDFRGDVRELIRDLYQQHREVLDRGGLDGVDAERYRAILAGSATASLYRRALKDLSAALHRYHGERVVILIDEYDAPVHAAYLGGFADEVLGFFRAFLSGGLKSNPHLHRAVLTGILRIARESIFSGLNNLAVCSLLEPAYATAFGFTECDVRDLLVRLGRVDDLQVIQDWYNGYVFGGQVIYNPWSVLSFLRSSGPPKPYWLTTSSNDLIKHVLGVHATRLQPLLEGLLAGDGIDTVVDENIVLDDLDYDERALWSLLLFSGYLKAELRGTTQDGQGRYRLAIPNREVRRVYADSFQRWMSERMRGHGADLNALVQAVLSGDAETFERHLQAFAKNLLSYHDTGTVGPENLYQGFLIGLCAVMEPEHLVRSNRESGSGRPDVMIRPRQPGSPGVVMELKVAGRGADALDAALAAGLDQLAGKDYAAELRASGADPVHAFAVAFDGKEVRVRRAAPGPTRSGVGTIGAQ
ncbi:AAA family ATPase [Haliangium sp.]|uniref:AAA family ATPase n=1 Tax=Haliangium sp. TaxID=2663208 RepID=UPI003D0DF74D